MELEYGALVADKNKEVVGKIGHIMRDTWTGEQRKFIVRRQAPQKDIFFSPEHIAGVEAGRVILNLSLSELESGQER